MFLTRKNLCFCAGDAIVPEILRYRKFPAISTQPKTRRQETRVGGDSHSPSPAMPQPCPFSRGKAHVFVCIQTPESRPEVHGPGHPKHEANKHVLEATPTAAQSRNATALPAFYNKKRVLSHRTPKSSARCLGSQKLSKANKIRIAPLRVAPSEFSGLWLQSKTQSSRAVEHTPSSNNL